MRSDIWMLVKYGCSETLFRFWRERADDLAGLFWKLHNGRPLASCYVTDGLATPSLLARQPLFFLQLKAIQNEMTK